MTRLHVSVLVFAALAGMVLAPHAEARQFRSIKSITTPQNLVGNLPPGAVISQSIQPVPREAVERRMEQLLDKWNTSEMEPTLAEEFYDRTRLLDKVETEVPKDAQLRLLGIQGSQTLQQYSLPATGNEPGREVSIVSVTVQTQLEYSSTSGVVRLPGTNEYLLQVIRTLK